MQWAGWSGLHPSLWDCLVHWTGNRGEEVIRQSGKTSFQAFTSPAWWEKNRDEKVLDYVGGFPKAAWNIRGVDGEETLRSLHNFLPSWTELFPNQAVMLS